MIRRTSDGPTPYRDGVGLAIDTARLHLRMMRAADAPIHAAYRNDPENARYQLWDLPYTVEQAVESLSSQGDRDEIALGDWTTLAIELDGEVIGDVVTNVDPTGGIAEIGYTLARAHHGQGYASEAAAALAAVLFDEIGVGRVYGELAPGEPRVAARARGDRPPLRGRHEEVVPLARRVDRQHVLRGDEGGVRRVAVASRPRRLPPSPLVPLDTTNERLYSKLATHHSQERLVAPMLASFADALFPEIVEGGPVLPWFRGIEADGEPAGFVMVAEVTEFHPEPYLWRLLIDRRHQRRGIGSAALAELFDHWRAAGATSAR